jgi:ammonia channel protein AmtB
MVDCACAVVLVSFVHPLIVHWIWAQQSWLNKVSTCRVLDYAGGLPVHALGE